jgi:hypothetical protein
MRALLPFPYGSSISIIYKYSLICALETANKETIEYILGLQRISYATTAPENGEVKFSVASKNSEKLKMLYSVLVNPHPSPSL